MNRLQLDKAFFEFYVKNVDQFVNRVGGATSDKYIGTHFLIVHLTRSNTNEYILMMFNEYSGLVTYVVKDNIITNVHSGAFKTSLYCSEFLELKDELVDEKQINTNTIGTNATRLASISNNDLENEIC